MASPGHGTRPADETVRTVRPPGHFPRPRVTALLEQRRSPVVVVVAPAGFGKTTAVVDWLEVREPLQGWVPLEEHDDEPAAFFARLAGAIEAAHGRGRLRDLISTTSGPAATELALAAAVVEDLAAVDDATTLVLDDLHVISSPSIHRGLQFMVDHLPDQTTLVLISRADPPLALARLRAAGWLTEVRAADLAFDPDESNELFARAGQAISPSLVMQLNQRVEGWAAGLRLVALSLDGRSDVEEFVESFSGSDRFIADYLLEEVLSREPEDVEQFLLESSLLEELAGELCDAVLGRRRSGELLDELVSRNAFVVPIDVNPQRFRYHALFAELLRARMENRDRQRAVEVLRSAAAWCRDDGDLDRCLRYLVRSGATEEAAALVARRAPVLLMRGEVARHRAWVGLFAAEVVHRSPPLLLTRAWSELFADQAEKALADLLRYEEIAPEGLRSSTDGQVELMRAIAAWFAHRPVECIEHAERSLERLADTDLASRCVAHLYNGVAELVLGDSSVARDQLELAREMGEQTRSGYTAFSARVATGATELRDGELGRARICFLAALDHLDDQDQVRRKLPIGGAGHLGLGLVALEQFELEEASDAFRRALVDLRRATAVDYTALAYRRWAETQSLRGDHDEAEEIVGEARHHLAGFGETRAAVQGFDACLARIALRAGDLEWAWDAYRRSASVVQRGRREFDSPEFEQRATAVRLGLALGQLDLARDQLPELGVLAGGHRGADIEHATLEAAVLLATDDREAAGRAIERAVVLAGPGWLRALVDVDPAATDLLEGCATTSEAQARLVERAVAEARRSRPAPARPQPLVDPLTARELEVLAEVAAGRTNAEIAERLFIAVGTTKRHVANIFMKLGAKHRAEAAAKARTLGIIE